MASVLLCSVQVSRQPSPVVPALQHKPLGAEERVPSAASHASDRAQVPPVLPALPGAFAPQCPKPRQPRAADSRCCSQAWSSETSHSVLFTHSAEGSGVGCVVFFPVETSTSFLRVDPRSSLRGSSSLKV